MDPSPKKKQKRMLIKLKSWSKKLVTSPKSNILSDNDSINEQPECNETRPQITCTSLDDSGLSSKRNSRTLTWVTKNNASNSSILNGDDMKSQTTKVKTRRNSFFGIPRLNSKLNLHMSRIGTSTTSNNDIITQQSKITLPELTFNFDSIFDDFDQLCTIDKSVESVELNELNELKIKSDPTDLTDLNENENNLEFIHEELYNALPIIEEDVCSEPISSLVEPSSSLPPPPSPPPPSPPLQPTNLLSSSNNSSETPLRISIIGVECSVCTYMNYPMTATCQSCRACLPGPSGRSSQYSVAQLTYNNNKSIISENNLPLLTKTQMTLLKKNDLDYITVKKMFYSEIPRGVIKGIIRLDMPTKLIKVHDKYKYKVAKHSGKCVDDVTFSMFHGTATLPGCDPDRFLDRNSLSDTSFCKKGCGMCGIIQNGNRKKFSKHNKKMWFAHSALISRDYTDGYHSTKVMFVVDIVAEEHYYILVVNKNKATLPRFMILFE